MAASTTEIANLALSHLGQGAVIISALSSDTTREGKACRTFYPRARVETLKAYPWACAKKQATLTLVETFAATAEREWLYSYRLPTDCLLPRRILWEGVRNPRPEQQVPFDLIADNDSTAYDAATTYAAGDYASVTTSGITVWYRALRTTVGDTPASSPSDWVAVEGGPPKLLLTDQEDAILEYTADVTDPTRFDTDLENAIAVRLAFDVAPMVAREEAGRLRQELAALWDALFARAQANDYAARQRDLPPLSTYQAVRRYAGGGAR